MIFLSYKGMFKRLEYDWNIVNRLLLIICIKDKVYKRCNKFRNWFVLIILIVFIVES